MSTPRYQLPDLLALMQQLRDPQRGCPWDRKQTFASIVPYTLEEAYEVADSIEREDWQALKGELGDLLFQVVFYCQMAQEKGWFGFDDVVDSGLTLKAVRELFRTRNCKSIRLAAMLDKKERRLVKMVPDYYGFVIPDEFVVGFGLDYNEDYRTLPYVGILKRSVYEK